MTFLDDLRVPDNKKGNAGDHELEIFEEHILIGNLLENSSENNYLGFSLSKSTNLISPNSKMLTIKLKNQTVARNCYLNFSNQPRLSSRIAGMCEFIEPRVSILSDQVSISTCKSI
jgi:hypothetical protein